MSRLTDRECIAALEARVARLEGVIEGLLATTSRPTGWPLPVQPDTTNPIQPTPQRPSITYIGNEWHASLHYQ